MPQALKTPVAIVAWVIVAAILAWMSMRAPGAWGTWSAIGLGVLVIVSGLMLRRRRSAPARAAGVGLIAVGALQVFLVIAAVVLILMTWSGP